ncbi:MAG: hypothetical protein RQ729_01680 [Wenzhouxiangellaceae bacterium]|nr:hypothetical protein [Wenzhouxiangellaceae bacterium]
MFDNFPARSGRWPIALLVSPLLLLALLPLAADEPGEPFHEQVLNYLRGSNEVVPRPLPDVHPIRTAFNPEAIIPPQCYTRTDGQFNPCYVCHQDPVAGRENKMADGELQLAYSFSDVGMTNHWNNLFEDRSAQVAAIADEDILAWIAQDNYSELAPRLRAAGFEGWIPDLDGLEQGAEAFDEHGFARDGSHWVAFNYKPLPSTFWPTNGSTDDVMIRLSEPFRSNPQGEYVADIYRANLAIVEANIKQLDAISTLPVDERRVGRDLDGDGNLSVVEEIRVLDRYVGAAADAFKQPTLYPKGTEFLHTVRYVAFDDNGHVVPSTRMKEVRYMKKWQDYGHVVYARQYQLEGFEKEMGNLPRYQRLGDHGLDNKFGWAVQGFIEGHDGRLRSVTYEENLFCMGCHTSVGATLDKTFAFPRKVDGRAGWGYIDLVGMPDAPNRGETRGEIATYLERVGGGGEFRSNTEMQQRWFGDDGTVDHERIAAAADVHALITPSRARALELNKAYKVIVDAQDFIYGRDATVTPPLKVYDFIDNETAPTLPESLFFEWDIRLDWSAVKRSAPEHAEVQPEALGQARPVVDPDRIAPR